MAGSFGDTPIDPDELGAWLRLLETPKVGRESARKLLAAFGSPQAVIAATTAERRDVVGQAAAAALAQCPGGHALLLANTLGWLQSASEESPRGILTLGDPSYPALLLESPDPPLLLYTLGSQDWLCAPSIALVGSRKPTPTGLETARSFATQLSQAGLTVVSGLAQGVDGAAHEGALSEVGSTVAVVGTGLDRIYPAAHRELARRIAHQGLIVSEYPLGTPPHPANFPQRNRLIAGLARGTLVIEAALKSGSLITARLALEAGRDVLAVPGSIHSPQSRGCHALIKQGATLVETAQDALDELGWGRAPQPRQDPPRPCNARDPILEALAFTPVTLDGLVERTGWAAAELNARLLELELDGHVARLPGQCFQRVGLA
jgi:DNA processing protein